MLWVSYIKVILFANTDDFTFSFLTWMIFTSFSCLIALAGTSSIVLNRSSKNEHLCLVHDLREKAFSFLPVSMTLPVGFPYMERNYVGVIYYVEVISSLQSLLSVFIMIGC